MYVQYTYLEVSSELAFDWDEANLSHIARHDVDPDEAEQVVRNDPVDVNYETVSDEARWTSVGHTDSMRVLLVVWTMRGERCRVVTAKFAGRRIESTYMKRRFV